MRDSRVEKLKFKSKKQKGSALQRSNSAETSKQAQKEEKKKEKRQRHNQEKRP